MSIWLPWITAAVVLIVLPVAFRFAEDHPRGNAIVHEQDEDDPGPAIVPAAA